MTQDEMNKELDDALTEAIYNGDITPYTSVKNIKKILSCMVQFSDEQWQQFAIYCLQVTMDQRTEIPKERIQ
jgi:phage terminase large subunit-like protein